MFCDDCAKKILITIENIEQYRILHTIFKDDVLVRHHDVTLFSLPPLLRRHHFVTAIVVRRSLVVLQYVILYVMEDFLRNNISNRLSGYSEKRNNQNFIQKKKQTYKSSP